MLISAALVPWILDILGFKNKVVPLLAESLFLSFVSMTEEKGGTKLTLNLLLFHLGGSCTSNC